jgi:membrane protease YdiL (CAAX protease family)
MALSSDDILTLTVTIGILGIAYGLTYWVYRANQADRSARVGLYLLFGIPGVLLTVLGLAFAINGREGGFVALATGVGLLLPMVSKVRIAFARFTPMNADSAIDWSGLAIVLAVIGFLGASYLIDPNPADPGEEVGVVALLTQFLAEIIFAYILVGIGLSRTFRQATKRLGFEKPTFRIVGIALAMVFLAFFLVGIGGVLTSIFQPDVSDEIERISDEITQDVQNPVGAAFFGLGAGAGEELLLRGAIQPRYGILITGTLFALLHSQYGLSFVLLGIFAVGIMLGFERKYFGTTAAIITHAVFNAIVVLLGS